MTPTDLAPKSGLRNWLDRLAEDRPDVMFMAPYLVYLLLLGTRDLAGDQWMWAFTVLRGIGTFLVVWLVWRYYPPFGKPYVFLALLAGIGCAALWVVGQHLFDYLGVPRRMPLPVLFPGVPDEPDKINPFNRYDEAWIAWSSIISRIAVATTAVAVVEEIFWRGFLLRALIDWQRFEKLPLGMFTLWSFLFSSILSAFQHPDNWLVSVFCWFAFNALMYWKKSVWFLIFVHGFTNLVLYIYVVAYGDWIFW
ncbi:MAG: type II CAAX prenyl endopeptidase Rce1 family protein [Phycisphaerae bacterium]